MLTSFNGIIENYFQAGTYEIEIIKETNTICSCSGYVSDSDSNFTIKHYSDNKGDELEFALQSAGFIDLFFNYAESATPTSKIQSTVKHEEVNNWFSDNFSKKIIVPDTNIIQDCIFSTLGNVCRINIAKSLTIKIPRLSILELEGRANNSKEIDKRKSFLGYGELMYLKNNGAIPMNELNIETLTGFSKIRGEKNTDSWIRREINEAKLTPVSDFRAGLGINIIQPEKYVFITQDLVSSFSAIAENINTIYVSKYTGWRSKQLTGNSKQIIRLISILAVLHENVIVSINGKKIKMTGIWEGKTIHQWGDEYLYSEEIS